MGMASRMINQRVIDRSRRTKEESIRSTSMSSDAFVVPNREILTINDVKKWLNSEAYHDYTGFIVAMNESVKGKSLADSCHESEAIKALLALLDELNKWIDEIPPVEMQSRYGNKAYRDWHKRLTEETDNLLNALLPDNLNPAVIELKPYILDGFGNATRIDYGTGHEASFLMFLFCLFKLEFLTKSDAIALVTRIFEKYIRLCRRLQLTYRMEPAGSHGVWSLDDYQFIPFYWGSAQLIDHPQLEPNSFLQETVVDRTADEYMFMGCIKFINQVKTGPFFEHSNQLFNISGVPTWSKVNTGLMKMYEKEVLSKFPIVQHFVFGTLFSVQPTSETAGGTKHKIGPV